MYKRKIGRRVFLQVCFGIGVILVVVCGFGYQYRERLVRRYLRLRLDDDSEKGELSAQQFEVISAMFDVISPSPAPGREALLEFVNLRTSNVMGRYREYKEAAAMLESLALKHCGLGFASLETKSRETLLDMILGRQSSLVNWSERKPLTLVKTLDVVFKVLFFRPEVRFKEFVFLDLLRFYWSSSAGWNAVGYDAHPGVPSAFRAYTLPVTEKRATAL
jgi:hypothetical protein